MQQFHSLVDYAKDFSLLYVEDDLMLQQETKTILERIFKKIDTASDGEEALELFKSNHYDLIITDIEMPRLNGLEMSKEIKKLNSEIPIVIVSAYSNTSYFLEAIEIGINYYILKPMDITKLIDTLYDIAKLIHERVLAEEYRKVEFAKKVNSANVKLLDELIKISPNPVVVLKESGIAFINDAFRALFTSEELQQLLNSEILLHNLLNQKISVDDVMKDSSGFIDHFDLHFNSKEGEHSKISLKTAYGRKIFLLIKSTLELSGENNYIYTFNDITIVEYQKVQLSNYSNYMSELTYSKYCLNEQESSHDIINKVVF
ncbi:MAG: response regulator [Campylobacterota bacterium]|nr:response regulator [Campylobacterota bacterium]